MNHVKRIRLMVELDLKTSMLRSIVCDCSNSYILVSANVTVRNTRAAANPNNRKNIIIKNCAPFTNCIREIDHTQIDNAKDLDMIMPMHNLIV